jgi:hypothetical protein
MIKKSQYATLAANQGRPYHQNYLKAQLALMRNQIKNDKLQSYEWAEQAKVTRKRCIDHTWVLIFHGSKASILDCLCLLTIAVSVFVIYW